MTSDGDLPSSDLYWGRLLERETFGELAAEEQAELHALAEGSEERRQVLAVLDGIATPPPVAPTLSVEDQRLVRAVLGQHARTVGLRRRVGLAAAALLLPVAAAAAYLPWAWRADDRSSAPATDSPAVAPPVVAPRTPPADSGASEPAQPPAATSAATETPARHSAGSAVPLTAAALLAQAQQARSAGDYGTAIRIYQQLLRTYPQSSEAQVAQLSLAQLYLAQGNAGAALAGFEAYQRSGGAFAQEAHYGKIQALQSLGRTAEAKAEIRMFLALYPKSVQAATLRRKLGTPR